MRIRMLVLAATVLVASAATAQKPLKWPQEFTSMDQFYIAPKQLPVGCTSLHLGFGRGEGPSSAKVTCDSKASFDKAFMITVGKITKSADCDREKSPYICTINRS